MATDLAFRIKELALECGFEACGIIRAEEMKGYAEAVDQRITAFPESKGFYDDPDNSLKIFADPRLIVPWARSIIVCSRWYGKYKVADHLNGVIAKGFLVDSRKDPRTREYQGTRRFETSLDALGIRHVSDNGFGVTAMRWAAAKAGIGIIRKNNFLCTERGSWTSLEVFIIDHELEMKEASSIKKCPENCTRCIEACPTRALQSPFSTNGTACVTFLTGFDVCSPRQKHGDKCGAWIYGCDACQDACPFNKDAWSTEHIYHGLEELAGQLSYELIMNMDYELMRSMLPPKFWYIQPGQVWKWKCNVLNAMKNTFKEDYLPYIKRALKDSQPEVREMAAWVFESVSVMIQGR